MTGVHRRSRGRNIIWRRAVSRVGIGLAWLTILLLAAWAVAALYIDLPKRWQLPTASVCVVIMLVGVVLLQQRFLKAIVPVGCFAAVLVWWLHLSPSNERIWQTDVARTAWAEVNPNLVTLHNLRNFDYRTETNYAPRWETRTVDLNRLQAVDLFITFWGSPWIAHPILSFQFAEGSHVAISVETRKEIDEDYSALRGFFRQYELIYIIADERDVIRLRTNYRTGEEVYLYRTTVTAEDARAIFLDYLRSLNALHQAPKFYNAITSNCTTNIRIHTAAASAHGAPPWDWRLLLNGKGDEFAYQYGRLAGNLPFDELKRRAHINADARAAAGAEDYSARIRLNRPGFLPADGSMSPH